MKRLKFGVGEPVRIVSGPYKCDNAKIVHKLCGDDRAWLCRSADFIGMVMVYETEIRQGKED